MFTAVRFICRNEPLVCERDYQLAPVSTVFYLCVGKVSPEVINTILFIWLAHKESHGLFKWTEMEKTQIM